MKTEKSPKIIKLHQFNQTQEIIHEIASYNTTNHELNIIRGRRGVHPPLTLAKQEGELLVTLSFQTTSPNNSLSLKEEVLWSRN